MTKKIGLTGGIGSGKSVVSHLLNVMGIPVYISDIETKRLMLTDEGIRQGLVALLGPDVYLDGSLNKPMLAAYLFSGPEQAARINAIVHPRVKDDFRRWAALHTGCELVGMESAILIESGFASEVDSVVMVYAPEEVRVARAMQRDGASRSQIEARVRSQMDDERKKTQADYVIVNDGETPLIPQVLSLISSLSQNIPYLCPSNK